MKRSAILLILCMTLLFSACRKHAAVPHKTIPEPTAAEDTAPAKTEAPAPNKDTPEPELPATPSAVESGRCGKNIKAIWLTQFDLYAVYTQSGSQRSQSDFHARATDILTKIRELGFNTVFLQIRPNGDSMYPSDYYPMSKYVVGRAGAAAQYDPVSILVTEAHALGLEMHAWINPLRVMTAADLANVPSDYRIRIWYDTGDGTQLVLSGSYYYLNPAYEETRALIVDGAAEALSRYDFDGLHIDDYFYPTNDAAFDSAAYTDYQTNGGSASLADFRRNNINQLVAALYQTASAAGVPFGVSPAGNIKTVYESQYADIYTWCAAPGYIDYICPQVYFGLEHQTLDFVSVCKTYDSIIQRDDIDLIVGMTLGKAYDGIDNWAGSGKNEWSEHKDVLARCLKETAALTHCSGISIFSYQYFYDPLSGTAMAATADECTALIPALKNASW